jgi:hypothetical protein
VVAQGRIGDPLNGIAQVAVQFRRIGNDDFEPVPVESVTFIAPTGNTVNYLMTWTGEWVIGLPANVRAWSHTPYGFLFKPLLWPGIFQIASRIYGKWADKRYERKYACAIGDNRAA